MTRTLTLEVDEVVLERAEAEAKARGGDVCSELMARLEELGTERRVAAREAIERMIARARANPVRLIGGMPNRDERNER